MPQPADLLITGARAFTADEAQPHAEAVAVRGGRIVFVGRAPEAVAWRGPTTRVVEAAGRTLMPGFIDSHFHLLGGSLELGDIQLAEAASWTAFALAVQAYAASRPDQPWLVGQGVPYHIPGLAGALDRRRLDALVPDRPLVVFAYDHHTAWANTEALRRAGLLQGGATVAPNSEIVREADGTATGELREPGAYRPITDIVPSPDGARKRALLHQGLALAAQHGITSVHNMDGDAEQLALYAALEDSGELTLRIYVPYSVTPATPVAALAEAVALREAYQSEMVRAGAVKFFMDGVIESYTALLLGDYADAPGERGGANFSAEHFTRMAAEADRLGLQMFVHAIGDAAVRRTLDGFASLSRAGARHRIEHIELIHPDDLSRFAALGVIASMQPVHAPRTAQGPDIWPRRVGRGRWGRSFAWRSLRQAGARLVFGSDWPVVTQNPITGVHAALNREPWAPGLQDHRQSLAEALLAYTRDAAYAEFQEHAKGQLRVGMYADLVLLSEDVFAAPVEALDRVRPVLTVSAGRIMYAAEAVI